MELYRNNSIFIRNLNYLLALITTYYTQTFYTQIFNMSNILFLSYKHIYIL